MRLNLKLADCVQLRVTCSAGCQSKFPPVGHRRSGEDLSRGGRGLAQLNLGLDQHPDGVERAGDVVVALRAMLGVEEQG
jgi:hypothetical protein